MHWIIYTICLTIGIILGNLICELIKIWYKKYKNVKTQKILLKEQEETKKFNLLTDKGLSKEQSIDLIKSGLMK